MHSCHSCSSIVHRALVTYANEKTGEIRVKIPAVTGNNTEISISRVGRTSHNGVWVTPHVGEQIIVSADDENMTNLFWLFTDIEGSHSKFRNYFEAYDTGTTTATVTGGIGDVKSISYNTIVFNEGIRLVDGSKMTFDYEGIYNFQYSIQWQNTDSQAHETVVWIAYNGAAFPDSSTYVSVPSKHGSINGTTVTAINFVGKAFSGDYIELKWAGSATTLSLKTIASGSVSGLPSAAPTAPSVIVTITQVG